MEQTKQSYNWPPTEESIKSIASYALNTSEKNDVNVLVYWDNPGILIFDPVHFAQTDYVRKKFTTKTRTVEVTIGRED